MAMSIPRNPNAMPWYVPGYGCGQTIEIAYAPERVGRRLQHWKRVTDRSLPVGHSERVTYRRITADQTEYPL